MSDNDPEPFPRETLVKNQMLHTEYQEVNQEFRHRNQLLHNTFYLFIITAGVFVGLFIRFGPDANNLTFGGLIVASGLASTIIGHLFLKHFHERSSAEVVRMHTEQLANGERDESTRALSLEWGVAGGGAKYDEERQCIVRRGSHIHYLTRFPKQPLSAELFGLVLIYTGALGLVGGVAWIGLVGSVLTAVLAGLVASVLVVSFYRYAQVKSAKPGKQPIY